MNIIQNSNISGSMYMSYEKKNLTMFGFVSIRVYILWVADVNMAWVQWKLFMETMRGREKLFLIRAESEKS